MSDIPTFRNNVESLRANLKSSARAVLLLKTHPAPRAFSPTDNVDLGEVLANIMLAYRHLEDAAMRLGKVLQAYDGGVSCYDKAPVVNSALLAKSPVMQYDGNLGREVQQYADSHPEIFCPNQTNSTLVFRNGKFTVVDGIPPKNDANRTIADCDSRDASESMESSVVNSMTPPPATNDIPSTQN